MKTRILAVDTGWNTGIAYFTDSRNKNPETHLIKEPNRKLPLQTRLNFMFEQFRLIIHRYYPKQILIEGVEFYGSSLKSVTATRRGDLFVLAYMVGGYAAICDEFNCRYRIQTFSEWGGQMSPAIINARLKRALGWADSSQHINDALAMGLTFYGNKYFREVR